MRAAPETWLDHARWKRLRAALDAGVPRMDLARRFSVGHDAVNAVAHCRTLEEARAALVERSRTNAAVDRQRYRERKKA